VYGEDMDRRQRKTREAIFQAFTELLSQKDYHQITVGEIIEKADIGRATFYAHFETKDFLLREICQELFCHILDVENDENHEHRHIFECAGSQSTFLHLFLHFKKNDNHILTLISSPNHELFLNHFRTHLEILVERNYALFESPKYQNLPQSFWKNHIASTFMTTLRWWISHKMKESPEVITEYFFAVV
jgi:AcrR family transcriptional regulator